MASTKLIFIRDRTITLQFDAHRIMTGDTVWFAMKNDRKNDFYDIEPVMCTFVNERIGHFEVTITNDLTANLEISKYYGELVRLTATGSYQTLQTFDIDLQAEIINSRDI